MSVFEEVYDAVRKYNGEILSGLGSEVRKYFQKK